MAIRTVSYLKSRFTTGSKPTQEDFFDLIDTCFSDNIIQNIQIDNDTGHMIVTFVDQTIIDVGNARGVGIASASIDSSGHLIITRTDSTIVDAGLVKGADGSNGVGIASASIDSSGHLIITRTDSTIVDAGLVKGADGSNLKIEGMLEESSQLPASPPSSTGGYLIPNGEGVIELWVWLVSEEEWANIGAFAVGSNVGEIFSEPNDFFDI